MFNNVYYGEKGLTSTSANFIANKSKEIFEGIEKELDEFTFVNVTYKVAGAEPILVEAGKSLDWLKTKIDELDKIGKLKALNAWLREAVKQKDDAQEDLRNKDMIRWLCEKEETIMERPRLNAVTEDMIINQMTVGERQKYLELEAQAANIGKIIHRDGSFNKARKIVKNQMGKQDVTGVGTPSLTVSMYSSSVPVEEIDKLFMQLQDKFRKIQAELNGIKHAIKEKETKENDRLLSEYQIQQNEYDAWFKMKNAEFSQFKNNEMQRIADLKVIIPDNLKDIYEYVQNS